MKKCCKKWYRHRISDKDEGWYYSKYCPECGFLLPRKKSTTTKITDRVHKKLCVVLEKGTKAPKKDLLKVLELIYQEWEYMRREWEYIIRRGELNDL